MRGDAEHGRRRRGTPRTAASRRSRGRPPTPQEPSGRPAGRSPAGPGPGPQFSCIRWNSPALPASHGQHEWPPNVGWHDSACVAPNWADHPCLPIWEIYVGVPVRYRTTRAAALRVSGPTATTTVSSNWPPAWCGRGWCGQSRLPSAEIQSNGTAVFHLASQLAPQLREGAGRAWTKATCCQHSSKPRSVLYRRPLWMTADVSRERRHRPHLEPHRVGHSRSPARTWAWAAWPPDGSRSRPHRS